MWIGSTINIWIRNPHLPYISGEAFQLIIHSYSLKEALKKPFNTATVMLRLGGSSGSLKNTTDNLMCFSSCFLLFYFPHAASFVFHYMAFPAHPNHLSNSVLLENITWYFINLNPQSGYKISSSSVKSMLAPLIIQFRTLYVAFSEYQ